MGSALDHRFKNAPKFGFDKGINNEVDPEEGISDTQRLLEQLEDDKTYLNPLRLGMLLSIAVRGDLESKVQEILQKRRETLKKTNKELSLSVLREIRRNGFIPENDFAYNSQLDQVKRDDLETSYGALVSRTLNNALGGELRSRVDLQQLQNAKPGFILGLVGAPTYYGDISGARFSDKAYDKDDYYNNTWLEQQVKNEGSENIQNDLDEVKGEKRRGKIFGNIREDLQQANVYASSLPLESVNYFSAGSLIRTRAGVIQGLAINLSWTKTKYSSNSNLDLTLSIENLQINNIELISEESTMAIGQIGVKGLKLNLSQDQIPDPDGYLLGLFKTTKVTLDTLMSLLPNVLTLVPYAAMSVIDELQGSHNYTDIVGQMMSNNFYSLKAALSFTQLQVSDLYDTTQGFLDNVSIEKTDESGNIVEQTIKVKENNFWTTDAQINISDRIKTLNKTNSR